MDKQTKRELLQGDRFAQSTEHGLEWADRNRATALTAIAVAVAAILILVGGIVWYQHRSAAASAALGAALQTYDTPVASPTRPLAPGEKSFPDAKTRALKANEEFLKVADTYGFERDGKVARYFAGLSYMEAGNNAASESTLKTVADFWSSDLSALGKFGLAQLYRGENRNSDAEALYKQLADGHATTITPGMAKIALADLYTAEGRKSDADAIYARLKDSDKDKAGKEGPLGALAAQKLNPAPPAPASPQL